METRSRVARAAGIGSRPLVWAATFVAVAVFAAMAVLAMMDPWPGETGAVRLTRGAAVVVHPPDSGTAAVRRMTTRLASARSFTVDAVRMMDAELLEGRPVPDSAGVHVEVKRPDKVHAVLVSPGHERHFYFDGHTVTVYDATKKFYATEPVRGSIDDMLRFLDERFSFMPPLAEFLANDPWAFLGVRVRSAELTGTRIFNGARCRQVNITGEMATAYLWLATDTGLPCGLSATFTRMEGSPNLRTTFANWRLDAAIPDARFVFTPPPGARRIPMMPLPASGD
jgi:hypothetical protein